MVHSKRTSCSLAGLCSTACTARATNTMDTTKPLATLPAGYGSLVDALAAEAGLDVRLSTPVLSVERDAGGRMRNMQHTHSLSVRDARGHGVHGNVVVP